MITNQKRLEGPPYIKKNNISMIFFVIYSHSILWSGKSVRIKTEKPKPAEAVHQSGTTAVSSWFAVVRLIKNTQRQPNGSINKLERRARCRFLFIYIFLFIVVFLLLQLRGVSRRDVINRRVSIYFRHDFYITRTLFCRFYGSNKLMKNNCENYKFKLRS